MRTADDIESSSSSTNQQSSNGGAQGKARHGSKAFVSRAKPTPSKWDDAQKWLVGLSDAGVDGHKNKPRNSNADDRKLLSSSSQNGRVSCSSVDGALEYNILTMPIAAATVYEGETKKIDCVEPQWKAMNPIQEPPMPARSVCLRDMGTEMTPTASKEPSRTGTPLRATTPVMTSPVSSNPSSPQHDCRPTSTRVRGGSEPMPLSTVSGTATDTGKSNGAASGPSSLESRAMAWDEAERAKYMARYKREEIKIQAWENHEKRRAEMELKKIEVKAEQMKARAQEKMASRLAATRRIAEEKRAAAEAKLNEHAARTSEKADYIRRTGHLPSSFFSFGLPSFCG